ncbi:MAG: hypothetical protein KJ737_05505 [Proteobacteria bacterium]|nr:hypothetical protein [Pseudomonadota bacterium]
MVQYPEIISEMINSAQSGKLNVFRLSEFMSGPSLEDVYRDFDKSMFFFSVYVYENRLEENLWRDDRFAEKETVRLCSLVEEKTRQYWFGRQNDHLKRIDARMAELRSEMEFRHMKEGELRDKSVDELNQEIYPEMIEQIKEEYKEMYEDEWEKYWVKEDPFKERIEIRYHRRYDMPNPFNQWDSRNIWQQFYFAKNNSGEFYYTQGGSASSSQRYYHGFYGHLFALLNSEKPVSTFFFDYDSRNRFVFKKKENSLWLNHIDLTGNFKIDWVGSREILKGVNKIKPKGWLAFT